MQHRRCLPWQPFEFLFKKYILFIFLQHRWCLPWQPFEIMQSQRPSLTKKILIKNYRNWTFQTLSQHREKIGKNLKTSIAARVLRGGISFWRRTTLALEIRGVAAAMSASSILPGKKQNSRKSAPYLIRI